MKHPKHIINLDELEYDDSSHGKRYETRIGEISRRIGAQKLGYNLTVIPAGKRAFPFHSHHVNEEMFLVLEGEGEIRIGEKHHPIRNGDVICCPAGGPETAHQLINTMERGDLKFLAVSTEMYPEVCQYPDTGKKLVRHYWPAESGQTEETLRIIIRDGEGKVDYWEGED